MKLQNQRFSNILETYSPRKKVFSEVSQTKWVLSNKRNSKRNLLQEHDSYFFQYVSLLKFYCIQKGEDVKASLLNESAGNSFSVFS